MPYFLSVSNGTLFECMLACALVICAALKPQAGRFLFGAAHRMANGLGRTEIRPILLAAALPVAIRLLLLAIDAAPLPSDMEEYNQLLQAQTYALGRLANPVHPLAVMLQSFQVVEWPHRVSGRPPLPALPLILPAALGVSPFAGNLAAIGLTSAALCWMLLGWVPRAWAVIGSFLAICTFCLFGYWINSYWCPTTTVLGAALLLGLVPRVQQQPRLRWGALAVLALVLLAGTRPYEDGVFAGIIFIWLLVHLLHPAQRPLLAAAVLRFALPTCLGGIAIVLGQLAYNHATTGNLRLMPYQIWRASQEIVPTFLWQPIASPPVFYNASAERFSHWEASVVLPIKHGGLFGAVLLFARHAVTFRDLLGPLLFLPLLCWSPRWFARRLNHRGPFAAACCLIFVLLCLAWGWPGAIVKTLVLAALLPRWHNRRDRLPMLLLLAGMAATSLPSFYMNVYAVAFTAPLLILVVTGLRHLSLWSRPLGPSLAGFLLLGAAIMPAAQAFSHVFGTPLVGNQWSHFDRLAPSPHHDAAAILDRLPGKHVIFLRTLHDVPTDPAWLDPIWNAPDVDAQKIVWLRDLRPAWTAAAESYYQGRQFWLMVMDNEGRFTLTPYPSATLPPPAPLSELPHPDQATAETLGAHLP